MSIKYTVENKEHHLIVADDATTDSPNAFKKNPDVKIASIGPVTTATIKKFGFTPDIPAGRLHHPRPLGGAGETRLVIKIHK
ncbi:MAG: hypothetical protein OCC46_10660 [Pseudodesulfovibrio sp.]